MHRYNAHILNRTDIMVTTMGQAYEKLPSEGLYHTENVIWNVCNDD